MTLPPVMGQRIFAMSGSIARCDFSISLAQRFVDLIAAYLGKCVGRGGEPCN